jgi:hypothetical protein
VHEGRLVGLPFVLKVVQDPAEPKSLGASMQDGIVRDGARSGTTTCLWPFLAQSGTPMLGPLLLTRQKVIVSIHEEADRFSH